LAHPIEFAKSHPKLVLDMIVQRYGIDLLFEFSVYEDRPGLVDDHRDVFRIPAENITDTLIAGMIANLPDRKELALNSRVVQSDGNVAHIPMVDFSTGTLAQARKLTAVLPAELYDKMIWFNSGRSFHGYGPVLIGQSQWVELMGRLLLANRPGYTDIVDPRWVGHRLIAGYSALRWSRNTSKYLHAPKIASGAMK
jgi:hypothetical protein